MKPNGSEISACRPWLEKEIDAVQPEVIVALGATAAQSVALSAEPGAIIVYTTDGSTPAVNASLTPTNGTLYASPINVSSTTTIRAMAFRSDYKPSFVTASTYIFLDDVINQSPTGVPPTRGSGT